MKIDYQVDSKGLLAAFESFPEQTIKNVRLALRRSIRDIQQEARNNHRFTSRTGQAERAVNARMVDAMTGEVFLDDDQAPWAKFLHEGTGIYGDSGQPYMIAPKDKKALRWVGGASFVFSKYVMHPGIESDPFLHQAAINKKAQVQANITDAVHQSIREAGLRNG